jgi:hypothetical protein
LKRLAGWVEMDRPNGAINGPASRISRAKKQSCGQRYHQLPWPSG